MRKLFLFIALLISCQVWPIEINMTSGSGSMVFSGDGSGGIDIRSYQYIAWYNGQDETGAASQVTGMARSSNLFNWTKYSGNPVILLDQSYDAGGAFQPSAVKVGNTYYVYYSAYGPPYTVALATTTDGYTMGKHGNNPIIQKTVGAWDATGTYLPKIFYDTNETDSSRKWKMMFIGYSGATYAIGYAYSADGYSWTKYSLNPVLQTGAGWEAGAMATGPLLKEGGTYYLFYEGYAAGLATSSWGLATSTSAHGPFVKNAGNPLLANRSSAETTMTATLTAGATYAAVADSSVFSIGEVVILSDDQNDIDELARIHSLPSSTQVNFYNPVANTYNTGTKKVTSIFKNKVSPTAIIQKGGKYYMCLTGYSPIAIDQREFTGWAVSESLDSGWSYYFDVDMPLSAYDAAAVWDRTSAENLSIVVINE